MKVTAQDSLQRGLASEETEHTPGVWEPGAADSPYYNSEQT